MTLPGEGSAGGTSTIGGWETLRWRAEHPSGRGDRRPGEGRVTSSADASADAHRNGPTEQQRALLKAEAGQEMLGEATVRPADGLLRRVLGKNLSPLRARASRPASGFLEDPHSFVTEQQREHQRAPLLEIVYAQAMHLGHCQAEQRSGFSESTDLEGSGGDRSARAHPRKGR